MKRKGLAWLMILISSCFLISCRQISGSEFSSGEEQPEALNVFIVSDTVHVYGLEEYSDEVYYTTMMTLGDFFSTTTQHGSKGHMFYDAFEEYQEQTDIQLKLHWYEYPELMEADLEALDEADLPDLILSNFTSRNDYARYMAEGMFYDLTELCEQWEMYSGGSYYQSILHGGEYQDKQYILPILFNVDTVMGAKRYWAESGLYLNNTENMGEILDMLIDAQQEKSKDQTAVQFVEASPSYLPYILYGSSGEQWVDYENGTVNLDQTIFEKMCRFYTQFLNEQLKEEDIVSGEPLSWAKSKNLGIIMSINNDVQLDEYLEDMGCILEGGGAFKAHLHSAAAQAWYYESRYRDLGEDFVLAALPGKNGGTTAHISYFGAVLQTTKYPEAAFRFLRYLMDEEVPAFFGISINRENALKQMDYLTSTTYRLRPGTQIPLEDGRVPDSQADYVIQPMSGQTKEQLLSMIDEIETVSLPNWPVYAIIEKQLQSCAKGEIEPAEAYQNTLEGLKEYLQH